MSQTSDVAFRVRQDIFATLQDLLHPPEYALKDHIQPKLHHIASLVLQESTAVQLGLHLQAVIVYQDRTLLGERRLLPARLVLLGRISRLLVKAAALGAVRACTATRQDCSGRLATARRALSLLGERPLLPARLVLLGRISRWLVKAAALVALRACTATPRG